MKEVSTVVFRENFSDNVNQAAYGVEPVVLTRRGRPVAVMISMDDFKDLRDYQNEDEV